ncbi:MAG TPA: hypothetical protein PK857_00585 [Hyphomicrobium sp.]|nr:hypothetical protein [Hyphomicrobium sp.]HRO48763.1 hypothetical protein [Hyphomicrobium sp.]
MAANRQGGQVRVSTSIDQRGRVAEVPSSGAAEAHAQVATEFGKIGARVGALADHAAAVEGERAGKLAGLDPEFRPTRSMTIRGEAFDRHGLQVAETRLRQDMLADLDGVFQQHQNDPAGLQAALAEKRRGWLSEALPELRPALTTTFDGAALTYSRQAQRQYLARLADEEKGALTLELGEGMKRLSQQAYALGLDAGADEAMAGGFETLSRALARTDLSGNRLVSPAKAAETLLSARKEIATARINGAFSRLPGLGAKAAFIEKLKGDFGEGRGIAGEYDAAGFERVVSSLEADYRSARAAENTAVRALGEDIKSSARILEKGFDVGEDAISSLKGRLVAMEGAEGAATLARDLAEAEAMLAFQKRARVSTPAELEAWTATERRALEGGEADAFRVARLSTADTLLSTMRAELKADPVGWADRVGLIKAAPLDFSNAESAEATVKARLAQAEEVAAIYGQEPVYLRPDEKRAFAASAAQGGEQMLGLSAVLANAAGSEAPKIIAEIAPEAPVVAMVAGLTAAAGPTAAARDAADGVALSKTDGFKSLAPSKDKARQAAAPLLGRVLSEMPQAESAAIAAANSVYEVRARRRGAAEFDEDLWREGLAEVLGQRTVGGVSYGGVAYQDLGGAGRVLWPAWSSPTRSPVVLPPNVRTDALPDLMGAIQTEDLARRPRFADGSTAPVDVVRQAKLKNAGDGLYFLSIGDPESDDPMWLMDVEGDKYVLDLKGLLPELGRRRPELVLGGE